MTSEVDPRLASALAVQLRLWRASLAGGARRVGWKLGMGDRERIGAGPVIGHLTTATLLPAGATFQAAGIAALHADAEVAIELTRDVEPDADRDAARAAIGGYGAALELVDLGPVAGGSADIVATNVFHRAVAFAPVRCAQMPTRVSGQLIVGGAVRDSAPAAGDYGELVRSVAVLLGCAGERLRAGDLLITGSVVQVPVAAGDHVVADLGPLGSVGLSLA
jgi:2-keto-4-pentenoate hydratase